ncbi:ketoacyl-synt-domain-containing protein, partial [Aureobasidium melanogenum]
MAPYIMNESSSSAEASGRSSPLGPARSTQPEPIAIVGMGCRLPGDVRSPIDLWKLLVEERSGQCDVPASRWNIDSFYHPDPQRPGSMNTRGGYFLKEDIRSFDNSFFGINNIEATYMDPQQRKLLEVCYECFESAGAPIESVSGANIACYVGNFTTDYMVMQAKNSDNFHRYNATGMGTTILSNRISHVFNLTGPSVVLDTACSSSLYAVHMACQAIDAGECDGAIAAGANLIQSPEQHMGTMRAGVLSGTSTCHTFDVSADGYGRADGIGAVYLKKLSKAIEDNDPIRAVIRGSAVNANGKTNGITLPSADGQEAVIRKAYAKAGLQHALSETAYVECHGTGTPVGDPIEVEAVSRVFGKRPAGPLLIGSVKTNLGHSEAASGFSSIFKVALALEKSTIPPTIGIKELNPKIKADEWGVEIVSKQTSWPSKAHTSLGTFSKRAGINSFGYGGANSHVILEAVKSLVQTEDVSESEFLALQRSTFLLPVSGNNAKSLEGQIQNLASADLTGVNVVDLAYTLGARRSRLGTRAFTLAGQKTLRADVNPESFISMESGSYAKLPLAFVFTGQGAQWAQMGMELIESFPSFNRSIMELDAVLQTLPHAPTWTLRKAVLEGKETSQINHVTRSQPICTAIQIAYVRLLSKWGIKPEAVIGHSSGEIAAAFASGFLSAAEAIIIAFYRGYAVEKYPHDTPGAMMAVGLGSEQAQSELDAANLTNVVQIAAVNSPESVTLSGDLNGIDTLLSKLQERGVFARKLNTNGRAYHSHHMAGVGAEYLNLLGKNLPCLPHQQKQQRTAQWISSVTGKIVSGAIDLAYWRKNLESPVRFSDAVEGVFGLGKYHLIELGPHSALELPIKQTATTIQTGSDSFHYSAALTRGKNAVTCLLHTVGNLWLYGHDVDFTKVNYVEPSTVIASSSHVEHRQGKVLPDLPPYAWSYDTLLWNECRQSVEFRTRKSPHHDLLGTRVPGGNGLQTDWRNLLKLENVPWLRDHKLDDTTVFPGAGYIAMAIEAVCQVTGVDTSSAPSFHLRHIQILKALVLSSNANDSGVDMFTTLVPMALSGTTKSKSWFEFEISSFNDGISTIHAAGMVSIGERIDTIKADVLPPVTDVETLAIRNWYGQFIKVGLNFGPAFTSLEEISTPKSKSGRYAVARTKLLRGGGNGKGTQSAYAIHPITIDALLQAGIIASTSGVIKDLGPNVPVAIEEAHFQYPRSHSEELWHIDASAEKVGFATNLINATLHDGEGHVIGHLKNAHAAGYQGADQVVDEDEREPMLRILWKPDVDTISGDGLSEYLDSSSDTEDGQLAAALDLITHKISTHRILELNASEELSERLSSTLKLETAFKRCKSYVRGHLSQDNKLMIRVIESSQPSHEPKFVKAEAKGQYDLVIVPCSFDSCPLESYSTLLAPHGILLYRTMKESSFLDGYSVVSAKTSSAHKLVISTLQPTKQEKKHRSKANAVLLVEEAEQASFNNALVQCVTKILGTVVDRVSLQELEKQHITSRCTVISTIELTRPVMSGLTAQEMTQVKLMTDNALNIIWLTDGDNIKGQRPDLALISGLSRALMLEQPSLKFFTLDMSGLQQNEVNMQVISSLIARVHNEDALDFEYALHKDTLHISRMVPEEALNQTFRTKQGKLPINCTLKEAQPARLTIGTVGQFDTLCFKRETFCDSEIQPGYVEVEVKSVGLNAKDFYALAGKVETKDGGCKLECAGVVTRTSAHNIERLAVGDRVVVMAPGHFLTHERFPEWACQKLEADEDFNVVATLPVVYATAIYGLHHRAHIQEGESVLIHSAAGGLGIAAIQIAQLVNANIFATVSTEAKKDWLVQEFGLRRDQIFNSRDSSFLTQLLEATDGEGVDIVLNSLTGDLLHDSWRACAPFGRFIEVGKRDIVDAGKLDMAMFQKNVTFSAFDMSYLYDESQPKLYKVWSSLVAETISLYRQKKIKAVQPLKVFDVSEMSQAYRYFGLGNRMGKVAISLEDMNAVIPTLPSQFDSSFSPEKTYLLIGCLGGLGRSISKWMVNRGARKFVFIGRTATDRLSARLLVDQLQAARAEVQVVRGDVGVLADVQKAVDTIKGPIGGVVQAAMGLDEALWTSMSVESWHTGIDPKLIGSWNLYEAIQGRTSDLDFFLMTSSVSGSVGTATEGNYCAANYFLDVFARFLKGKGLPAMSIGLGMISEVGYLHENPEIEALLLRKGIQAINEDELLQIVDIALSQKTVTAYDVDAASHILTGLEPLGMKQLRKAGFTGTNPTMNDPRATILASALDSDADVDLKRNSGLPAELAAAIDKGESRESVVEAALVSILSRFSNLVLLQLDKIDVNKPLARFGMDSMLAAEFRTWFYQAFKVDIPFLTLLAETTTLKTLGELVSDQVMEL